MIKSSWITSKSFFLSVYDGFHFLHRIGAVCTVHFNVNRRNIISRRAVRKFECRGNLLIGKAFVQHERDFHLPIGKSVSALHLDFTVVAYEASRVGNPARNFGGKNGVARIGVLHRVDERRSGSVL